jgi:hypothetical protein
MAGMGSVGSVLDGVGGTSVPPLHPVVREHVAGDQRAPRLLERVRAALSRAGFPGGSIC